MAQCEQKTMYFDVLSEDDERAYIDLASCLTTMNRRQYHHVGKDGNPNCYRVRVSSIKGSQVFSHASNAFITCNAVKQTTKGWKAQMRHGGIKLRDLPPYGRRPRFALEDGSWVSNTEDGEEYIEIYDNLAPKISPGGLGFFTTYDATDTMRVAYQHSTTAGTVAANQITQVVVTDGAGNENQRPLVLLGTGGAEFNVIREYLSARRQTPDYSIDTPGPSEDSAMLNLFSIAEEMSDDIIDAIDDYMDYKPYTPDHLNNVYDEKVQGCEIGAQTLGTGTSTTTDVIGPPTGSTGVSTTETNHYPPLTAWMDVPLGLLEVRSDPGSSFSLTVEAFYEM